MKIVLSKIPPLSASPGSFNWINYFSVMGTPYDLFYNQPPYVGDEYFTDYSSYFPMGYYGYVWNHPVINTNNAIVKVLVYDSANNYDPERIYYYRYSGNSGNYAAPEDALSQSNRITFSFNTYGTPNKTYDPRSFKFAGTSQVLFRPVTRSVYQIYDSINVSLPNAYITTPAGNISIGTVSETLAWDATKWCYLGPIRNYYNIPGRIIMNSNGYDGATQVSVYYGTTFHSVHGIHYNGYSIENGILYGTLSPPIGTPPFEIDLDRELAPIIATLSPGYTLKIKHTLVYSFVASCKKQNIMMFTIGSDEGGVVTSTPT